MEIIPAAMEACEDEGRTHVGRSAVRTTVLRPIPFTLQVLFVLLAGLVLGPKLAAMSMVADVARGLVAPVYAGGASGLGTLIGPAGRLM